MLFSKLFKRLMPVAIAAAMMAGCKEQIDTSARYVFLDETVYSYLSKHDQYSQYADLLGKVKVSKISTSTLKQLLAARGNYTVFAPTNEAIQRYLDTLAMKKVIDAPSWDGFRDSSSLDSIREIIVYNSIIDAGDNLEPYETGEFPILNKGEFPLVNMYSRKLYVTYSDNPDSIWVNGAALDVNNRDIKTENGVIHCVHNVVAPTNNTLGYLLESIFNEKQKGYYVAAQLVRAAGMLDTLYKYQDDEYERRYQAGLIKDIAHTSGIGYTTGKVPEHRFYGYTFFAETDEFWEKELGKDALDITVKDVKDYLIQHGYYPEGTTDDNYTEENNIVNLFITYHFMPMRLAADRLVLHWNEMGYSKHVKQPTVVQYEYYTTMGKRRLLKFLESAESDGVCINRFPNIDNGRHGTYHELSCDPDKVGIPVQAPETGGEFNVRNGIIYPLDQILAYTSDVRHNLHKERIRWDITAQFPEFMNNDIRLQYYYLGQRWGIPMNTVYRYLDDCSIEDDSYFFYYNGYDETMKNYQGDELNIRGNLDVTFRLPPVPEDGIYELRFNIQSDGYNRGMVQFYWGSDLNNLPPMGIPLDIRMSGLERRTTAGTFPSNVGWLPDVEDDDAFNAEVDKKMRNNGFMKGANIYCDGGQGLNIMARADPLIIRRVIVREPMKADETYYVRFKTVLDDASREFYVDFLEFCPKEVYDNPETPEDIW
ncbi:MAG: fasciclin domain-containing protein [Prevotellaceae bacterium]|nr:fasciclin domain-containing protein [Prevotellaceae bacterium]